MKVNRLVGFIILMFLFLMLQPDNGIYAEDDNPADTLTNNEVEPESDRFVITPMMGYQGRLVEDGVPVTGERDMTFSLWDSDFGGSMVWDQELTMIPVIDGLFQVELTIGKDIDKLDQSLYLQVTVDGVDLPRQRLLGAPYALSLAPGAEVTGGIAIPMLRVTNESGVGIAGSSTSNYGVSGTSSYSYGIAGMSDGSTGVFGQSNDDHGVSAVNDASGENHSALYAYSAASDGVSISAFSISSKANIISRNYGSGALFEGNGADSDVDVPEFVMENDGTVQQELGASGLVKAGYLIYCADSGSTIIRGFNNVIEADPTTIENLGPGFCLLDLGFDISQRYWVTSNPSPAPFFVSCALYTSTQLWCHVFTTDGSSMVNGDIMLLIY